MIRNDQELAVARERVGKLEHLLEDLRRTARPEEWHALSSGYRLEIERMQGEVLDYLVGERPNPATSAAIHEARQVHARYETKKKGTRKAGR